MKTFNKTIVAAAVALGSLSSFAAQAEWSANASVTNNYIWRGLTQTTNEPAVQGGIDYASESGFYFGTWASNVQYAADDVFSYEHDIYFGFAGEVDGISYDVGYLYYNYDGEAEFDFGEIYASVGMGGFSVTGYLFTNTEADDVVDETGATVLEYDFGNAYYISADYAFEVKEGVEMGFHVGHHSGDFNEGFNGVPGSYTDYNVSVSKDGFTFMVSSTDLDDSGADGLDNDSVKFVVAYAVDFEL